MSLSSVILEGLQKNRSISINESSYVDIPTSGKARELQKTLTDTFKKKYFKELSKYGAEGMGVEVYTHDDDEYDIDDAIYEITLYIDFGRGNEIDYKTLKNVLGKVLRYYPKFSFDKSENQFYSTIEEYGDIIDCIDLLVSDGAKIRNLYNVVDANDIEYRDDLQRKRGEEDRQDLEREYNRQRL